MCCSIRISGNFVECYAAAAFLQKTLPSADLDALNATMWEYREAMRGRTFEEKPSALYLFVTSKETCGIYEWRPMGCRQYNSYSKETCWR
jgi:Fe-S-cluster containining protein